MQEIVHVNENDFRNLRMEILSIEFMRNLYHGAFLKTTILVFLCSRNRTKFDAEDAIKIWTYVNQKSDAEGR